jgi:hypothetical protein
VLPATHTGLAGHPALRRAAPRCIDAEVELHVADRQGARGIGADGNESPGIVGALRRHRDAREHAAEKRTETPVARHRAQRQPGVRQNRRNTPAPARVEQIRPQLRLHDDDDARARARDQSPHGARRVVRQIPHGDRIAEQCQGARTAGGRRRGQHDGQFGMAGAKRADERGRRRDLTQGHRVQHEGCRRADGPEAETLAQGLPVAPVAQTPP